MGHGLSSQTSPRPQNLNTMASIIASDKSTPRELIPAGNYIARCFQMVEIGTVTDHLQFTTTVKKVRIGWELPEELKVFDKDRGEEPLMISKEFTLSMNPKANLRKMLASWRGKDFNETEAKSFDITKLLGKPCMLNIIHKNGVADPTKVYEAIAGITPLPKSVKCPEQINETVLLTFDEWNDTTFKSLPEFLQTRIISSSEFQARLRPQERNDIPNADDVNEPINDLPF